MSSAIQESFEVGEAPSAAQMELFGWAEEAIRKEMVNVADGLRHLTTITVALLGGAVALAGQLPMPAAFRVLVFVVLLAALATSLWGGIPRTYMMSANYLSTIEAARNKAIRFKTRCLKAASALLVSAFAALLIGLLWHITVGG